MDAGKRAAARYAVDTFVKVSWFHFQKRQNVDSNAAVKKIRAVKLCS